MPRKPRTLRGAIRLALSLTVAASPFAQAQQAADAAPATPAASQDRAVDLDKIVVTGRSGTRERSKAETSYSITRIEEDRLRLQAPTSVTEAMKSVPGFWVEASGGEASGNIRARGIPVDGYGSVNILEDGVPVQHDPALGFLNGDQAFRLDETIERIEVVRGGPSSVFYSNAPAGAINFVPRVVGDQAEGTFKMTVGDYGLARYDAFFGTPLGNSGWKLGVGGFFRSDDGIRDPGFQANHGGQYRINLSRDFERGRFSVDYKHMNDNVALFLGIPMRTYADGEIRAVPGFDGNYGTMAGPETQRIRMLQGDGSWYDFDNSRGTEVKRDQFTVKLDYELGAGWKLAEALRYNDTETQRNGMFPLQLWSQSKFFAQLPANALSRFPGATGWQLRYANDPTQIFDPVNQNGNGLLSVGGLRGLTIPVKELINDTRIMRSFDFGEQSHDVTFGYYYARIDEDFDRYSSNVLTDVRDNARLLDLVAVDANGNPVGTATDHGIYRYGYEWENASGRSTTHAFYLSDEWQVNEKLRIDAGVRWEKVSTEGWTEVRAKPAVDFGTFATSNILAGSGRYATYDESFDKLGWTIGANWQFNENSGVFARWTSAFRLPNLSTYITRYSSCDPNDVEGCISRDKSNPNTRPIIQTMDLGEVGYKFSNQYFDLFATAFYTKYDNVGFSNAKFDLNNTLVQEQGYASTRTFGLELEANWYPVQWFDMQLTATVQDPQYRNLRYYESVGGGALVLRDYVGNQLIRVPKNSFRVVPGVNLFDDRLRLQVAYEYEGERFVDTANSVRLPSYDVINASARWQATPELSFFLYADNLDNSLGLTEGNPRAGELQSADAGANTFLARPLLGRSYRFAVMYKF